MLFNVYVSKTLYHQGNRVFGIDHVADFKKKSTLLSPSCFLDSKESMVIG